MDLWDRLQAKDFEQASAIMACVVYNAASRSDVLPRKPLPKPTPPREGGRFAPNQRNMPNLTSGTH